MLSLSPRYWSGALAVPLVLLAGCATTRYDAEVRQASEDVAQRTGWQPEWSAPWASEVPQWDGQTPLSVEQAVTIALQNNRALRADVEQIGVARADFVQAGLLPNPLLSVALGFPEGGMGSPKLTAGIVQPLADLWLMPARRGAAEAELRQQVLRASRLALELVAKVEQAHARTAYVQDALTLLTENADVLERSQTVVARRRQAGASTALDTNRMRAAALRLSAERLSLETELEHEKRGLLELMGLAGGPTSWDVQAPPPSELLTFDEDEIIAVAQAQRLDVLAATWTVEARRSHVREQSLAWLPTLELGVEVERDARPRGDELTAGQRVGNLVTHDLVNRAFGESGLGPPEINPWRPHEFEPAYTLGPSLSLDLPVFDQHQAQIAAAQAELRSAQAMAAAVEQQAIREARQACVQHRQAVRLAEFYEHEVVPLMREDVELARQAFEAGQNDLTVLLEAQQELIAARSESLRHRRDVQLGRIELAHAVGGALLLPEPRHEPATTQPVAR